MDRRKSGFTLVEILVVIAIMAIIGAGAVSVANKVVKTAKVNKTKAAISNLVAALEEYYRAEEKYPVNTSKLFDELTKNPKTSPIVDKLSDEFKTTVAGKDPFDPSITIDYSRYVDSWGIAMRYINRNNGSFPKIISAGTDKVFDTADDIVSTDL